MDYITKPLDHDEVLARVNAHLTIQRQKKELVELNATKDRFFSIIAHDLRSPFTSLLAMVELISDSLDEFDPDELKGFMHGLGETTKSTYKLLENLLEWARMQQGTIKCTPIPNTLTYVVKSILDVFFENARQKDIELINEIPENVQVLADEPMLATITRNLVNNAIKFTQSGDEVRISCQRVEDDFIKVSVTDTGVGLSAQAQQKVFRIDEKHKTKGTAGEKGTGLGLLLCKEFVEKNGGRIRVESEENKGSAFSFTLPQAVVDTKPAKRIEVIPPRSEIEALDEHLKSGNMPGVHQQLDTIVQQDADYQPFVDYIRGLADDFEIKKVTLYLEDCLNN